jgi:hypothetical protein
MNESLVVNIRQASNGFIVQYEETHKGLEISAEFVALDLGEALDIIQDMFSQEQSSADMSNILDTPIEQDKK